MKQYQPIWRLCEETEIELTQVPGSIKGKGAGQAAGTTTRHRLTQSMPSYEQWPAHREANAIFLKAQMVINTFFRVKQGQPKRMQHRTFKADISSPKNTRLWKIIASDNWNTILTEMFISSKPNVEIMNKYILRLFRNGQDCFLLSRLTIHRHTCEH